MSSTAIHSSEKKPPPEFLVMGEGGVVAESINVGDGFECLHGSSPFDGHKKARWKGGREGAGSYQMKSAG